MLPFTSGDQPIDHEIVYHLKKNTPYEAYPLIEKLPSGTKRYFLMGWAFFIEGKIHESSSCFSSIPSQQRHHSLIFLQTELCNNNDEEKFLNLLDSQDLSSEHSLFITELRALSLLQLGKPTKAEYLLRQELEIYPTHQTLKNALATVLSEQGIFDECLNLLKQLCSDHPNRWEPINNLACILNHIGHMEEAINLYRRAITISPNTARIRLNHSIALLKAGRFSQGWNEHEWRLKMPGHSTLPSHQILPSLLKNKTFKNIRILITQEEGLGDTLMYLRYLPLLSSYGAYIHVWGSQELANLTKNIAGVNVVQVGGERPVYDYHCPFISLPRVFSNTPHERLGASVPYLHVSADKRSYWSKKLPSRSSDKTLRVGIAWAGGQHKNDRSARLLDRHRSLHLSKLSSFFKLKNISFYSLQKGSPSIQLHNTSYPVIDLTDECHDMEDTAALIEELDLVITVDTSIVHLAGGLGKKVFLMDRFCNCWRWGYKETSSVWYPSLRIFRQEKFDDWSNVIHSISKELLKLSQ